MRPICSTEGKIFDFALIDCIGPEQEDHTHVVVMQNGESFLATSEIVIAAQMMTVPQSGHRRGVTPGDYTVFNKANRRRILQFSPAKRAELMQTEYGRGLLAQTEIDADPWRQIDSGADPWASADVNSKW